MKVKEGSDETRNRVVKVSRKVVLLLVAKIDIVEGYVVTKD